MKTFFKHLLAWLIPLFLLIGFSNSAMAQDSAKDSLKSIIRALDSFSERQSLEKALSPYGQTTLLDRRYIMVQGLFA